MSRISLSPPAEPLRLSRLTTLRSRRRRRAAQAGFSLIEIMTVLAIIIALTTVATVKFGKTNVNKAVGGLTRETSSLLQQARFTARSSQRQVCVVFNSYAPSSNDVRAQRPTIELRAAASATAPVDCATSPMEGQVQAHRDVMIRGFALNTSTSAAFPGVSAENYLKVVFFPNGQIQAGIANNPVAPVTGGVSLFLSDTNMLYRQQLLVYSRTGFPKIIDR